MKNYSNDLKEFGDLRNAIIHESTDGHVIAEPNDRAVKEIDQIVKVLLNPPKVIPLFQKKVLKLGLSNPISEAVKSMQDEFFSQIPIYDGTNFCALLSSNTIARWLGASVTEEIISLKETSIKSVLGYTEERDNFWFIAKDSNIFEALEKFREYEKDGKKLEAILITHSGKSTETPIGIITLWDLPQIYNILRQQ